MLIGKKNSNSPIWSSSTFFVAGIAKIVSNGCKFNRESPARRRREHHTRQRTIACGNARGRETNVQAASLA
ncbi:Hypothetical protein NTJ_04058 [Nesidiocoris tenuis]|uniref:Uncharacterized protein n=1 Tax=Nesidiocoris tenuis TaxID=355587 RepID=A0ABN7AG42_9HEMI|nr:Hypothetical protein NTJ_04058 [Nesidiocoris tenuis]